LAFSIRILVRIVSLLFARFSTADIACSDQRDKYTPGFRMDLEHVLRAKAKFDP